VGGRATVTATVTAHTTDRGSCGYDECGRARVTSVDRIERPTTAERGGAVGSTDARRGLDARNSCVDESRNSGHAVRWDGRRTALALSPDL
jgi:hypothetical protein